MNFKILPDNSVECDGTHMSDSSSMSNACAYVHRQAINGNLQKYTVSIDGFSQTYRVENGKVIWEGK